MTTPDLQWGEFRRTKPFSDFWGLERGRPIDRYYIEKFLAEHQEDIRGLCLEMENPGYCQRFGMEKVEKIDILDIAIDNLKATIVSDLSAYENMPRDQYDCFVLTQTLQFVYDLKGAIKSAYRLLKPGGIVLGTVPGITPIPVRDGASRQWCWSFTCNSVRQLFGDEFGVSNVQIQTFGNVLSATSFLWGLSQTDLTSRELDVCDPDYQVLISVRAQKPSSTKT